MLMLFLTAIQSHAGYFWLAMHILGSFDKLPHFKMHNVNMRSSFTSTVLTGKSPEFTTQPTLTASQLLAIITLVYLYTKAQMHLQAFKETCSRRWLILYSSSSPGGATPSSQNELVYTYLRTVVLAVNREETRESRDTLFSLLSHWYSWSLI